MMLHQIGRELEAHLVAKGCPYKVYDREPRAGAVTYAPRIIIEYADDDKFGPPRGLSTNPKKHYTRTLSCKISIYGKSLKRGALEFEHLQVVDQVLDMVLVAMRKVGAARLNRYTVTGGRPFVPADLEKSEVRAGAAYELKFEFDRAVSELNWAGEKFPEAEISGVTSRTLVSPTVGPDDDNDPNTPPATAETACGA